MKSPKVAVILFPGSNCELEALRAVRRSHMDAELIRWNDHGKKLSNYDAFILPGGFSYEDRGRSGIVASKDPIMKAVQKEGLNGKPVLGICNGAQILVETGMIPGLQPEHLEMALAWSVRKKNGKILGVGYYNEWIHMRHNSKPGRSVFNRFNPNTLLTVPIAHGEGRFTTEDKTILKKLIQNDQTLFRYCNENGEFIDEFPVNPNGAMYNLAGVCNPQGNVMALMPHPERTFNGQPMFNSIASYLKSSQKVHVQKNAKTITGRVVKSASNPMEGVEKLQQKPDITILVRLIITDNEERTLENTLKSIGLKNLSLYRQISLGFWVKNKKDLNKTAVKLIESGEILNLNKEIPTIYIKNQAYSYSKELGLKKIANPLPKGKHVVAMEYDNYAGKSIFNILKSHEHIGQLVKVERGIHWTVNTSETSVAPRSAGQGNKAAERHHAPAGLTQDQYKDIIGTHIFHNPHSMKLITV